MMKIITHLESLIFNKKRIRNEVSKLVEIHRNRASNSPYDHKVSIMAIGAASMAINDVAGSLEDKDYLDAIENKLSELRDRYNDRNGEYTSGKGEIGSLLADIVTLREDNFEIKTQ